MKRAFYAGIICLMLLVPAFVKAQDTTEIKPGDAITGEITNSKFEIAYSFDGTKGETIVVVMKPVDTLGDLDLPEVILLNADNDVVSDSSGFGSAILATTLPDDGTYTILATRRDGRSGESVGEYTLELVLPEEITADKEVAGTASSANRHQYYVIKSDTDFSVGYLMTKGKFFPEVKVNKINDKNSELESVASMSGDELSSGMMGFFEADTLYIVEIGEALFDFNFDEVTANYTLTVVEKP